MLDPPLLPLGRHHALRRFWKSARGFWHGPTARLAWGLIALLIMVTVFQLLVQYRLNLWNRDFFNALEFRNAAEIWRQTQLLLLFAAASIGLAVTAVWGRMTFQRSWRGWVSRHLIAAWLGDERYRRIDLWNGEHQNAEYRIAEDARQATDAPIDLVIGLLASVLTAGTFVVVLWNVGGALDVSVLGIALTIPGDAACGMLVRKAESRRRRCGGVFRFEPNRKSAGIETASRPSIYHPSGWEEDVLDERADRRGESEKVTINLGYVDLGQIDLLVREGFYSNRTDFIRTAIRAQLDRQTDAVKQSVARRQLELGLRHFTRAELERVRAAGETLHIQVLGLAVIAPDVSPELARATIASVHVLGALQASPDVKAALGDRIL